jgi:hypothetical protein
MENIFERLKLIFYSIVIIFIQTFQRIRIFLLYVLDPSNEHRGNIEVSEV